MKYTHVFVKGDAWTPQSMWDYVFLTKEEAEKFGKLSRKDGFIREMTETDHNNLKIFMEKKHANY
jgi:hypothetical protein